jgi:hypothetical protein
MDNRPISRIQGLQKLVERAEISGTVRKDVKFTVTFFDSYFVVSSMNLRESKIIHIPSPLWNVLELQ